MSGPIPAAYFGAQTGQNSPGPKEGARPHAKLNPGGVWCGMQNQNITCRMKVRGQTLTSTGMSGSFNPPPRLGFPLPNPKGRLAS